MKNIWGDGCCWGGKEFVLWERGWREGGGGIFCFGKEWGSGFFLFVLLLARGCLLFVLL